MDIKAKDKDFLVCPCKKKTKGELEEIVRKNRITDVAVLIQTADAGNKCGGCREDLQQIIDLVWEKGM